MTDELDDQVQAVFDEFWAPIVMRPDGTLNVEQVKLELHDYYGLLTEVPKVYYHVSEGRISKPHTMADAVIGVHDELFESRRYRDDDGMDVDDLLDMDLD